MIFSVVCPKQGAVYADKGHCTKPAKDTPFWFVKGQFIVKVGGCPLKKVVEHFFNFDWVITYFVNF